jgi:hypothetical protein
MLAMPDIKLPSEDQRWRASGTMAGPEESARCAFDILGIAVRLSDVIILEAGRQDLHSSLLVRGLRFASHETQTC